MGDLTVVAIPYYFAGMGLEAWAHERRRRRTGTTTAGDYELKDTAASLTMGVASLVVPLVAGPLAKRFDVFSGRAGRVLLGAAGAAALTAAAADAVVRSKDQKPGELPGEPSTGSDRIDAPTQQEKRPNRWVRRARRVAESSSVAAVVGAGVAITGTWAARTTARRLYRHRLLPDLGTGFLARAVAMVGWDLIYYLNHRFMHESRYMWAIHVVHHSSERYNLSTALRQPVADALGTFVPYGLLSLLGVRPHLIEEARGINLIYQFWIHTEAIERIGPLERWFNSPSHHRVHHGSNRQYLDRNHGGILIVWDKLFGTFEPEDEPVVYGLTKNLGSFNPLRIASHEHADICRDVATAGNWSDRLSFVLRGPGWAYERHRELASLDELAAGEAPGADGTASGADDTASGADDTASGPAQSVDGSPATGMAPLAAASANLS